MKVRQAGAGGRLRLSVSDDCAGRIDPNDCTSTERQTSSDVFQFLAQLDVRNINRDNKRISIDAGVWLTSEYAVHRRNLYSRHFYIGVHIVRARCVSGDFDVVVVTLEESRLIEIKSLPGAVGRDGIGEGDL